jgi:hypothetical protein
MCVRFFSSYVWCRVEDPLEGGEYLQEHGGITVQYLHLKLEVVQTLSQLKNQTMEDSDAILQL